MDGLSSICAGLGIVDEDDNGKPIGYAKGEHCLDNLKDLLRYLRRDDPEKREVFKQACKWNTVKKDLIPIIEFCQEDRNLVLNSVKVLVFLTMPVEPTSFDIPQQIEFLWGLKSAITYSDIIPVIVSLLESPLENLESESFTEDDWKLVQLVLTLFRNILAIQDISTQLIAGGSATQFLSIRDRFLELLFEENVMDLILVLSQHTGGSHGYLRHDNLLLLEIFHNIFKGQEPELIAKENLKNLEEQEKKNLTRFHNLSCYSQFSGTFTRVSVDGSKALLKGNPSASADALLKAHKNLRGPSKRAVWDHGKLPSTKHEILQLLDDFVSQFLKAGYNVLMQSIREDIEKELQEIQSSDVVIFFEVAQFVTAFQYHKCTTKKPSVDVENEASATFHDENSLFKGSMCGPIAETMNESMFLMVISKWRYAFEGLKQTNDYKFLSAAGSLVKIMIRMLDLVLKQASEDSKEPQTARILLLKLFYDQTEEGMTQFLLNLIKSFDTHKQSKSDLANLVESMHVVLRLLENLQARGTLRVAKKSRKKRTKKTMTKNEHVHEPSVDNSAPQNEVENPTCEDSVDPIMLEKETLANKDPDIVEDVSISDPMPVGEPVKKPVDLGSNESEMDGRNIIDNDGLNLEADSSSGDEQPVLADEVDLNVSSLVSALANNSIIQNLCWLLKSYKSNSITTNHYILTMLRRICEDLELSPMLYQLSLLTIFNDILEEQKSRPRKEYENIVSFLTSLVRRMLRKMKRHPLLFVEVLFWKTRKECHYINCESMLTELNSMKNQTGEERIGSEKGGNGLFEGQTWVRRSIADALGDDDFVASRLDSQGYKDNPDCCQLIAGDLDPNGDISKLQVSKTLKQLGIKVPAEAKMQSSSASNRLRKNKRDLSRGTTHHHSTTADRSSLLKEPKHSKKRVHAFSVDQEQEIKDLFEQFKDHRRCSYMIANALDSTGTVSAAKVSRKLKQLGLVRPTKKRSHASMQLRDEVVSDIHSEGADESDDETLSSLRNRKTKRMPQKSIDEELMAVSSEENLVETNLTGRSTKISERHSRKRVHAFSVDEEQKIKDLFEQFKDHSRCSYMIANALDSTCTVSAAQVSHKLKQLGLDRPKKKRSHASMQLRDEVSSDIHSEGARESDDDEPLSSLRNRKTKRKSQKSVAKELMTDSFEENLVESNLIGRDSQVSERYDIEQSTELGGIIVDNSSDKEIETIGMAYPNELDAKSNENSQHDDDMLADELADFDENEDPVIAVTSQDSSASRRRLRMVLDFDDDDD
ncbi:hypothetical protein MIMGU_mgv1a000309mg [Erythranthe guttata]|uniref:Timeless N-terminal domain-containing protein n=1 Tax=Erythranthe guttata TaxID=4155 RepID=A0A022Q8Z8_ERYGU|nr:hypothetical protein MIMGU_mgv1a000309mg [Erythranthe guttata]